MSNIEQQTRARFLEGLRKWDGHYDPEFCLLRTPFSSPGYHTQLWGGFVHGTRGSLGYAVICLEAGDEEHRLRAEAVIEKIVSLQDADPESSTYGIWSWFYEEPLNQMAPPDWNWANFLGALLIQILREHRDRVSEPIRRKVEESLRHACLSIIRRDVGPGYTNIAIMGAYVTLLAGELMGWTEIGDYGRRALRRFYDHTMERGSLSEYNSPTYTVVAITELRRLLQHTRDEEALALTRELHTFAWRHLARRFHAPTRQWSGPHSRCYQTLQGKGFQSMLQVASAGRLAFLPEEQLETDLDWWDTIPEEALPYFAPLTEARTEIETFAPGESDALPIIGTTYLCPDLSLGTVNQGNFWNQCRALIAYWGTHEAPSYLTLRLMHDGYDYASGLIYTTQRDGSALSCVTLANDGGDTHCGIDRVQNARIRAWDLRLRLEIGGAAATAVSSRDWGFSEPLELDLPGLRLRLQVPAASFGKAPVVGRIQSPEDADALLRESSGAPAPPRNAAAVDLIFYQGPETELALDDYRPFFAALALQLGDGPFVPARATVSEDAATLAWDSLHLTAPVGPASGGELRRRAKELG